MNLNLYDDKNYADFKYISKIFISRFFARKKRFKMREKILLGSLWHLLMTSCCFQRWEIYMNITINIVWKWFCLILLCKNSPKNEYRFLKKIPFEVFRSTMLFYLLFGDKMIKWQIKITPNFFLSIGLKFFVPKVWRLCFAKNKSFYFIF